MNLVAFIDHRDRDPLRALAARVAAAMSTRRLSVVAFFGSRVLLSA
jgi:hypothetical protein